MMRGTLWMHQLHTATLLASRKSLNESLTKRCTTAAVACQKRSGSKHSASLGVTGRQLIRFKLIRRCPIMGRALVTAKSIELPKELEQFFDNPPLVGTERREDYDKFSSAILTAEKPANAIHFVLAKEFVDLSWEIRRERGIKAEIIKLKQKKAKNPSGMAMTRADFARAKAEAENPSMFTKKASKPEKEEDPASFLAEAYMVGDRDIDIIDTRIASYLYRRSNVLRDIARYSEHLARKLEKVTSEVIDGEFTEAAE
jgi:hypothetical protein